MEPGDCSCIAEAFFGYQGITRQVILDHRSEYSPSQAMILGLLNAAGEVGMTKLAQQLAISKETASRTIVKLVEDGLVERTHAAGNRRIVNVALTDKGKKLVEELGRSYDEMMWESLSKLTDAEKEELLRVSEKASALLKKALL